MISELVSTCKASMALIYTSWISFILWSIGGFDLAIQSLLALMLIDYITGLWIGYKTHTLNSRRAYKGIKKKVMIIALVCCATVMNRLIPFADIRGLVTIFYCATEFLSVIENASKLGVPIPTKLKKALEQCKDGSCNVDNKTNLSINLDEEIK
jgi:hypothetical protein